MSHRRRVRDTGLRWRRAQGPYEALAAAIVLQAHKEWQNGRQGDPKLCAFLTSEWCEYLAEEGGINYRELLRQTVGGLPCASCEPGV